MRGADTAAIHWPIGPGRELHGYMAIPARARGRQPAVVVIGGRDTPDPFARQLVRSAARAGFVTCTANRASVLPDTIVDDMRATARWLADGRYGTGRVAAVGLGSGVATTLALAAEGALVAAVTFGDAAPVASGAPVLSFRPAGRGWVPLTGPGTTPTLAQDWAQAWVAAMAYLREHLT